MFLLRTQKWMRQVVKPVWREGVGWADGRAEDIEEVTGETHGV